MSRQARHDNRDTGLGPAKPVIAVDIDEVLIPFRPYFHEFYRRNYGMNASLGEFAKFFSQIEREAYFEKLTEFVNSGNPDWVKPIPGAFEAMTKLKIRYDVQVITARHNRGRQPTHDWLQKHFPLVFSGVHFMRHPSSDDIKVSKGRLCEAIGAVYLIDDELMNIDDCLDRGVKVLLFGDYPWNQIEKLPVGVTRVHNWDGVLHKLLN